jgi:hypothetical protein
MLKLNYPLEKQCETVAYGSFLFEFRHNIYNFQLWQIHRIPMCLGLLDPDLYGSGSINKQKNEENLWFSVLRLLCLFIFNEWFKCNFKKEKHKNLKKEVFFVGVFRSVTKRAGTGAGSVSQRYGSEDPDPHQYNTANFNNKNSWIRWWC